jgi:hypothetical protein
MIKIKSCAVRCTTTLHRTMRTNELGLQTMLCHERKLGEILEILVVATHHQIGSGVRTPKYAAQVVAKHCYKQTSQQL